MILVTEISLWLISYSCKFSISLCITIPVSLFCLSILLIVLNAFHAMCLFIQYDNDYTIACFKNNEELTEHLLENSANSCLQDSDEKNILETSLHSCNPFRIYE